MSGTVLVGAVVAVVTHVASVVVTLHRHMHAAASTTRSAARAVVRMWVWVVMRLRAVREAWFHHDVHVG